MFIQCLIIKYILALVKITKMTSTLHYIPIPIIILPLKVCIEILANGLTRT